MVGHYKRRSDAVGQENCVCGESWAVMLFEKPAGGNSFAFSSLGRLRAQGEENNYQSLVARV